MAILEDIKVLMEGTHIYMYLDLQIKYTFI
jgi:hypothetical protein